MARRACKRGLALAFVALAGARLAGSGFSAGAAKLRTPAKRTLTTADGWLEAARRVADGRPDASDYLEAAWEKTQAWWLRPVAYMWVVSLGCSVRLWGLLVEPQEGEEQAAQSEQGRLSASQASGAVSALQRLELPFFATSARWVKYPFEGICIQGNLREGALAQPLETHRIVAKALTEHFGHSVTVHLLEAGQDSKRSTAFTEQRFELLVRDVAAQPTDEQQGIERALAAGSLAVSVACGALLASGSLQRAGAVVSAGSALPVGSLAGLLLLGELSRLLVARSQRVQLTLPTFLPSPQIGFMGAFTESRTPCPSRSSYMRLALAAPLAIAAGSVALVACSAVGLAGDSQVAASQAAATTAWPLAALPVESATLAWAGTQGLLMAALMLMPSSPDGQAVVACLVGRENAEKVKNVGIYLYPLLGLLSAQFFGPGWCVLPFAWTFLLFNFGQDHRVPPMEEASDVSQSLRVLGFVSVVGATVLTLPAPVHWLVSF